MSFAAKIWLVILITVTLVAGVCIPFISVALPLGVLAILGAATGFGVSLLIENERRYKKRVEKIQQEEAAAKARQKAEHDQKIQRQAVEALRREEERMRWVEENGCLTISVANTTFSNPDRSSRQNILAAAYDEQLANPASTLDAQLERCEIAGEEAVRVLLLGQCVGTVPSEYVDEVMDIMDDARVKQLTVDYIVPYGEKRRIFTAELTISCWR